MIPPSPECARQARRQLHPVQMVIAAAAVALAAAAGASIAAKGIANVAHFNAQFIEGEQR